MPIFEYKCGKCGLVQSFLEKTSKGETHDCPKCNEPNMAKQFSTFSTGSSQPEPQRPACADGCTSGGCPFSGT